MASFWTIQNDIAQLRAPHLNGEVEILFPWRGFSPALTKQAGVAVLKVATRFSAPTEPETLVETYERGSDLVATYTQTPERNYRPQVYWRYLALSLGADEVAGVELLLSAQTSLLDSQPGSIVESTLPAGESLEVTSDGCAVLFRPSVWQVSYLEMIQPSDRAGRELTLIESLPGVRWRLFPESLEKGVIRRGRVRGLFVPRANDIEIAAQCYEAFLAAPPPLST
jgi:hypothetical protein